MTGDKVKQVETFTQGQPVKVYQRYLSAAQDGKIVRVGRDLVDIQIGALRNVMVFRKLDQRLNSKEHPGSAHFVTLEQHETAQRRSRAVGVLHRHGLRFDVARQSLDIEKLEAIGRILEDDH